METLEWLSSCHVSIQGLGGGGGGGGGGAAASVLSVSAMYDINGK
jgi:hypothetical protein